MQLARSVTVKSLPSQYVVVPSRRSSAEAFQLLAAHAFGEAGAPYLVGLMADAFESGMDYEHQEEYEYWAMQARRTRIAKFWD